MNPNLVQNYPNPFNNSTKISYLIDKPGIVTLKIYDIYGKYIQTLVNQFQTVNNYSIEFEAKELSSGIYYYKLEVGNEYKNIKKMILIK